MINKLKHFIFLPAMLLVTSFIAAQTSADSTKAASKQVKGIIKDAATGKPLSAISISVEDFSAAFTDDNGKFTVKVPDYNATLIIKGDGFQTKEISLKGNREITTSLYEENFNSVYDNAFLPFGEKSFIKSTFAASSVNTASNWNRNSETPDAILQGKVGGLNATMRSGTPNVGAYLSLRGMNSLYTNNQPLVIVDGGIFDYTDYGSSVIGGHYTNALATIDVKDIENITVIKDATSTYGTKGANGAIIITTTHANQLATHIDFAAYGGVNIAPQNLPVMQSGNFRTYLSDVLKSRGWTDAQIQAQPYMNDDPSNPEYYRYHNETDWQKQVYNNIATSNFYLKITGGDNIAKYALSMGYMKNGGVTKNTGLTKYNVRFNGDLNISKRLTVNTNLAFTYYEQNLQDQGIAPKTNPLYLALIKAPFLATNQIDDKGNISPNLADVDTFGVSNPVAIVNNAINNSKAYRFFGTINFKYQLSRSFTLATLLSITYDKVREQRFIPARGVANDTLQNAVAESRLAGNVKTINNLFNNTYVEYDKKFKHESRLTARGGVRFMNYSNDYLLTRGYNSATDDFISVGTGLPALRKVNGDIGKSSWINWYLGADYSLLNKYFFSVNAALDGSSKFGPNASQGVTINGNSFAFMPSASAAWLISSEHFMKSFKFIDVLKLRGSIGRTGNDDIGNYTYQQSYVSQNLLGVQGMVRGNISNPSYQWETNTKINAGIDVAFWNERLNISFDVFKNTTDKMVIYEALPAATGFEYAITNNGGMKNTGMELSVNARVVNKKSLKWDVGVMLMTYKNRVTQLPASIITKYGGATLISQVGGIANEFYGYKTNGVYATDAEAAASGLTKRQSDASYVPFKGGDVKFTDVNGDKIIDDNDRQYIGNPNPDYVGAISSKLTWKGFSLEMLFNFSQGNQNYNGVRAALESQSSTNNQSININGRWRVPSQITNVPKASWADPMGNSAFSDRWIEDGSFFRMKVLTASYNFTVKKGVVKYITLYVTGNNLLTFTKYRGYDPEFYSGESIFARGVDVGLEPQFKSVTGGVRFGL